MTNILAEQVKHDLRHRDKNYLSYFCGAPGSGKSEDSIAHAMDIHKLEANNIVFGVEQFFDLLNNETLSKRESIVFEELGVNAFRREYYTQQNKAMVLFMEYGRALNLALCMNAPGLSYIDSGIVKLGHHYFETDTIDYAKNLGWCRVSEIQYNPKMDKIYWQRPRVKDNGTDIIMDFIGFHKPPESIIEPYKVKKDEFIRGLNKGLAVKIRDSKVKKRVGVRMTDVTPFVKQVEANPSKFIGEYNGRRFFDTELISGLLHVGGGLAGRIKKIVSQTHSVN